MRCPKCGNPLRENERFCPMCGTAASFEAPMNTGERVTPNITLGEDGKFRWIYEMSLLKNPTIFILIWKIFFFIILGIFAFTLIADAAQGNLDGESALNTLKIFGYFLIGMTVIVGISMLIYAAIMGGKYVVMFTMDEEGINHEQVPTQAKKAKKIGEAAMLAGALSGRFGGMSAGMASQRTSMYSEFSKVRKVKAYPRRHLIKVRQLLSNNQVYAAPEDYDFVLGYIRQRTEGKNRE